MSNIEDVNRIIESIKNHQSYLNNPFQAVLGFAAFREAIEGLLEHLNQSPNDRELLKWLREAFHGLAALAILLKKRDVVEENYLKILEFIKKVENVEEIFEFNVLFCAIFILNKQWDRLEVTIKNSRDLFEKTGKKHLKAMITMINMAHSHFYINNDLVKAFHWANVLLNITENFPEESPLDDYIKEIYIGTNYFCGLYLILADRLEEGLKFAEISLDLSKKENNQVLLGQAYQLIGDYYIKKKDLEHLEKFYSESFNIFKNLKPLEDHYIILAASYKKLADAYEFLNVKKKETKKLRNLQEKYSMKVKNKISQDNRRENPEEYKFNWKEYRKTAKKAKQDRKYIKAEKKKQRKG